MANVPQHRIAQRLERVMSSPRAARAIVKSVSARQRHLSNLAQWESDGLPVVACPFHSGPALASCRHCHGVGLVAFESIELPALEEAA